MHTKKLIQSGYAQPQNIAIVGAGVAGTATLHGLLKADDFPRGSRVRIFESSGLFGPGSPYHPDCPPYFRLNHVGDYLGGLGVPPSTEPTADDDFFNWAVQNKQRIIEEYRGKWGNGYTQFIDQLESDLNEGLRSAFFPRSLYGKYLQECFECIEAEAKEKGILIEKIHGTVTNVTENSVSWIEKGQEEEKTADVVATALCTGHWDGPPPRNHADNPDYFVSPYEMGMWRSDDKSLKGKTVFFKGTGLSAVDGIFDALESGGADKVILASRRGKMRAVRGLSLPEKPHELKHLTLENLERLASEAGVTDVNEEGQLLFRLDDVLALGAMEFEEACGEIDWQDVVSPKNPAEFIRSSLESRESETAQHRRAVQDALFNIREDIYQRLSPEDADRFWQEVHSIYISYQAPMPPLTAEKLMEYIDQGRLEIHSGLSDVGYDRERKKFVARCYNREDGTPLVGHNPEEPLPAGCKETVLESDIFVKATGQDQDASHIPLIKRMIGEGNIAIHPSGYGVDAFAESGRVTVNGETKKGIYVTGPLVMGEQFVRSSPTTVRDARVMVDSLIQDVCQAVGQAQLRFAKSSGTASFSARL